MLTVFKIYRNGFDILACILYILTLFLSPVTSYAQKTESLYGDSLQPGSVIYVITNRVEDTVHGNPFFINEIDEQRPLAIVKATFLANDSLHIWKLDEVELVSDMKNSSGDWLLFVHGDSKTFEQAVMRGLDIQYLHDVHVIVFSWPSRDPELNGIQNFKSSKRQVTGSLNHFSKLLELTENIKKAVPAFSEGSKLSLFIHSLGNYFLENLVLEKSPLSYGIETFDNVIINAAAVNQDGHKKWVESLDFQKRIYITCNRKDFNLKGVRIFTKDGKQLGEKITRPLAENASYIHFTEAIGFRFPTGTTHTYYIGEIPDKSQNIKTFYRELFHGSQVDPTADEMFLQREDGLGYDIIF